MNHCVIYPGTFDPITYGHLDLIRRCQKMFDQVFIAVSFGEHKKTVFSVEERISFLQQCIKNQEKIIIESFSGLLVDYAKKKNIFVIVRGIRAISDFEYEFPMALTNRKINNNVDTIFLMPDESFCYISSRIIKEVCYLKGDISSFVPPLVARSLAKKMEERQKKS